MKTDITQINIVHNVTLSFTTYVKSLLEDHWTLLPVYYTVIVKIYKRVNSVSKRQEYFLIEIHSLQGWTATKRHGVTRKKSTKRLKHTWDLFRKNSEIKGVC